MSTNLEFNEKFKPFWIIRYTVSLFFLLGGKEYFTVQGEHKVFP